MIGIDAPQESLAPSEVTEKEGLLKRAEPWTQGCSHDWFRGEGVRV